MTDVSISELKTPPATHGLPVVGSLPQLLKEKVNFLVRSQKEHGEIYTIDLGVTSMVIVCTPEMADYVLRKNAKNFGRNGALWDSVRMLLGSGMAASDGDLWLRQRRMIQPKFHRQALSGITNLMIGAIANGLQQWDEWADTGKPVNFVHAFKQMAIGVIMQTIFGDRLRKADAQALGDALNYTVDRILPNMIAQFVPSWLPFPGRKKYQVALAHIDEILYRIIHERRQSMEPHNDLLEMLMQLLDAETGTHMPDLQLRHEVATLFLGGYESTLAALAWSVYLLTHSPDVLAKLTDEVDTVLGGQRPTFENMTQLSYTRMVLHEVLRIRPSVYFLPRTAIEDDEINGYRIAAGQMVAVGIYNIHHDPNLWDNPDVFDPERFSPERTEKRHQLAWMPFGAGGHFCLGRDLALMEITLVLAMMVQRYKIEATDHVPAMGLSTTLRPQGGVWATLAKRD